MTWPDGAWPGSELRRVGDHPVGTGLTVVPGRDLRLDPPGCAVVASAADVVRAHELAGLAAEGVMEHRLQASLEQSAAEMRALADADPERAAVWTGEALRFEQDRAARTDDPGLIAAIIVESHRARRALGPGRPLVVLGDHPALGDALDGVLDEHPQVVHMPDADEG